MKSAKSFLIFKFRQQTSTTNPTSKTDDLNTNNWQSRKWITDLTWRWRFHIVWCIQSHFKNPAKKVFGIVSLPVREAQYILFLYISGVLFSTPLQRFRAFTRRCSVNRPVYPLLYDEYDYFFWWNFDKDSSSVWLRRSKRWRCVDDILSNDLSRLAGSRPSLPSLLRLPLASLLNLSTAPCLSTYLFIYSSHLITRNRARWINFTVINNTDEIENNELACSRC